MEKTLSKEETLKMFDHVRKIRVKLQMSENKRHWEKWVSFNNKKWEFVKKMKTLDEVMKSQQEIIDNNYKNLFSIITGKK